MSFALTKLDDRKVENDPRQIRCFAVVKDEMARLPYLLEYHRSLGVDRFFFVDNDSTDGTRDYLLSREDTHCFFTSASYYRKKAFQTDWTNAILNVFGSGHWCVILDADELLAYPDCETVNLRGFCEYLEGEGAEGLFAAMIDMYGAGPVKDYVYRPGQPFLAICPWFDPAPPRAEHVGGIFPARRLLGGMRERVFWVREHRWVQPPTVSKIPLVRWRQGLRFLMCNHAMTPIRLSEAQGAILHFKFLPGVATRQQAQGGLGTNPEWRVYADAFERNPALSLWYEGSVKYRDSEQLVQLGWMRTTPRYREFQHAVSKREIKG